MQSLRVRREKTEMASGTVHRVNDKDGGKEYKLKTWIEKWGLGEARTLPKQHGASRNLPMQMVNTLEVVHSELSSLRWHLVTQSPCTTLMESTIKGAVKLFNILEALWKVAACFVGMLGPVVGLNLQVHAWEAWFIVTTSNQRWIAYNLYVVLPLDLTRIYIIYIFLNISIFKVNFKNIQRHEGKMQEKFT